VSDYLTGEDIKLLQQLPRLEEVEPDETRRGAYLKDWNVLSDQVIGARLLLSIGRQLRQHADIRHIVDDDTRSFLYYASIATLMEAILILSRVTEVTNDPRRVRLQSLRDKLQDKLKLEIWNMLPKAPSTPATMKKYRNELLAHLNREAITGFRPVSVNLDEIECLGNESMRFLAFWGFDHGNWEPEPPHMERVLAQMAAYRLQKQNEWQEPWLAGLTPQQSAAREKWSQIVESEL
jgi:hypothetical protein